MRFLYFWLAFSTNADTAQTQRKCNANSSSYITLCFFLFFFFSFFSHILVNLGSYLKIIKSLSQKMTIVTVKYEIEVLPTQRP